MSSKWAFWKISGPFLSPETSLSPQKVLQPVSSSSPSLSLAIGQCRRLSSKTMWWSSFVLFCPLVSCGCPLSSRLQSSTISTLCNAVPFILCSQVLPCPLVLQPQSGRCLPVHPQLARPFLCCCIVFLSWGDTPARPVTGIWCWVSLAHLSSFPLPHDRCAPGCL